jgi:AcrR family transcriptional regulator
MPPKVSFSRERILEQAFEIVRNRGLDALSAREIGHRLHSSTRPVYTAFQSMKALQEAVIQKAREYAVNYFLQGTEEIGSPFLSLGLQYFRFSQVEQELFKLLYLERRAGTFERMGEHLSPLLERMRRDPRLQGLSEASLKRMGINSWIYTHGLIALIYADAPHNAEELVRTHISQMGNILIVWEHSQKKKEEP